MLFRGVVEPVVKRFGIRGLSVGRSIHSDHHSGEPICHLFTEVTGVHSAQLSISFCRRIACEEGVLHRISFDPEQDFIARDGLFGSYIRERACFDAELCYIARFFPADQYLIMVLIVLEHGQTGLFIFRIGKQGQPGSSIEVELCLPASDERDRFGFVECIGRRG